MPLFPIANEPAVKHVVDSAARLPGMREIILLGGYPESSFVHFLRETERQIGLPVRYANARNLYLRSC